MMSYIISKVSQNTSGNSKYVDRADAIERFLQQKRDAKAAQNSKYVDRADAIERFLQQKRDAKAAQRAQASNSNKETTNKTDK